jgi:hypothetical protein
MTKMTDLDLLETLNSMELDAVKYNGEFMELNEELLSEYLGEPYGDELEGQSSAVSTDIQDLVEADMPSLIRVFAGANDILEFKPNTDNPEDIAEAKEKTQYINYLVRRRPESFRMIHDWIKDAEIQKFGVVKYYIETTKAPEEKEYKGLSEDELAVLKASLDEDKKTKKVEVVSRDIHKSEYGNTYDVKFRITRERQNICIKPIPVENFLITRNSASAKDAELLGDICYKTRGELIAEGYSEETVAKIPPVGVDAEGWRMKQIRFDSEGGFTPLTGKEKQEKLEIRNLYPLVDYDGDGIAERRNIIKGGDVILQNEPYERAPYAMMSAMLMPHTAIGRSRAEIVSPTQYIKTHLLRGMLNNQYQVNLPGYAVDDSPGASVDLDDLMTQRAGRVVRVEGNPYEKIMPLVTPYIGDKALQVIQYIDHARAQSTGSLMASQGLNADELHKETATRFEGVQDASVAKVELVSRVMAETGFRDLFDGLAWMTKHYQDEAMEIMILGKPLTVNPGEWRYEHYCSSTVGLGAGDSEQTLNDMGALLQISNQLMAAGSPLTDWQKVYNINAKIAKAMGQHSVSDFFNDPSQPEQLLMAENQQLKAMMAEMQAAMQNPEVEKAKIQAMAKIAVETDRTEKQIEADLIQKRAQAEVNDAKEAGKAETELSKFLLQLGQQNEQFQQTQALQTRQMLADFLMEMTKLDMTINAQKNDIPNTAEDGATP